MESKRGRTMGKRSRGKDWTQSFFKHFDVLVQKNKKKGKKRQGTNEGKKTDRDALMFFKHFVLHGIGATIKR
jgi:hypothetical protein